MAALGDPTRRSIFERLGEGPAAVGEIALTQPVSRPAVSQHLRVLEQAGLVGARREGNRRIYSLDPQGLEAMQAYFEQFWNRALGAFKTAVEAKAEESR